MEMYVLWNLNTKPEPEPYTSSFLNVDACMLIPTPSKASFVCYSSAHRFFYSTGVVLLADRYLKWRKDK